MTAPDIESSGTEGIVAQFSVQLVLHRKNALGQTSLATPSSSNFEFFRPVVWKSVEMRQSQQVAFVAHPPNAQGIPHSLLDHLSRVGKLASEFAAKFGAAELGCWAGKWHDVGKFNPVFQRYLAAEEGGGGPDHKAAGALLALEHFSPLCFVIFGHHGGLPSLHELKPWLALQQDNSIVRATLERALAEGAELNPAEPLHAPSWLEGASKEQAELFLRMLYSALVDADFLDTEQHSAPETAAVRNAPAPRMEELEKRFLANFDRAISNRRRGACNGRRHVLDQCRRAAEEPRGLFVLPISPPADRTIYAFGFGLRHAVAHGAERIILVVTARDFKQRIVDLYNCLKDPEQHLGDSAETVPLAACPEFALPLSLKARLAAENWAAPVVITTDSEFFGSLLANRPGRCRKLHNICRSIVILDEFQRTPLGFLDAVTAVLDELIAHYGATVVLASENLPALGKTLLASRLNAAHSIVRPRFRNGVWRAPVHFEIESVPLGWNEVAQRMSTARQALAVVNTKADALALFARLPAGHAFYLSSHLCPAHRARVLAEISVRLRCGLPCLVVGTQLAEEALAGHFPLVLRAMGPLERILLAGTCCTHGRCLDRQGKLVIFDPKFAHEVSGVYSTATAVTRNLLRQPSAAIDSVVTQQKYRQALADGVDHDRYGIRHLREAFDFPAVSEQLVFAPANSESVVVHYMPPGRKHSPIRNLIVRAREEGASPELSRLLRGYTVPVYRSRIQTLQEQRTIENIVPGLWEWKGQYDPQVGIIFEEGSMDAVEDF
jgi:CRISPR-associated endonuclease/helicase Cas3